jgi:hypothetical protein
MWKYSERLATDGAKGHAEKLDTQRFKFHAERNFYIYAFALTLFLCVA